MKKAVHSSAGLIFLTAALQFAALGATYSYDSAGHLIQVNYGAAGVVVYSYDSAGNLITRQFKAAPVITWPAPAAITYGGALSATQLNATASIPGTFVYNPPAGTVLSVGAGQALSVTFTPIDTTDYISATASTTITVNPAAPPSSPADLVVTKVLTRSGGNVVVQFTIANTGGTAAANVVLTSVKVGSDSATPLPQTIGTIGAGASAQATVSVPGSVGASGAASSLTLSGTYTGGTFSSGARITLP
jgi:YD repeat-containing protein